MMVRRLLADAVALCLKQLLHPLGKSSAQVVDFVPLVDIHSNPFHPRCILTHTFCPWLLRPGLFLQVSDPTHSRLMQHELMHSPWLCLGVVTVVRFEAIPPQSFFELWCNLSMVLSHKTLDPCPRTESSAGLCLGISCPLLSSAGQQGLPHHLRSPQGTRFQALRCATCPDSEWGPTRPSWCPTASVCSRFCHRPD